VNRVAAVSDAEAAAIRAFVSAGGTVVADHLTGVLDEHGVGRAAGGALDDLFGIRRDETKGYLDGRHITEIDGELYQKPFLERLQYAGALRHEGIVIYERGTRAAGGRAAATVGGADAVITKRTGRGQTVYLNLTNMAYNDMNERLGEFGRRWRELIGGLLRDSGLEPRARVLSGGKPVPLAELVYWRRGDRVVVGLVKNPVREASVSDAGRVHDVTGDPLDVEIVFRRPVTGVRDLRSGKALPDGRTIRARWKPWEALLYEVALPAEGAP
jgi:hypothetical protein